MKIVDFPETDKLTLEKLIQLTWEAGKQHNPFWLPTTKDAKDEVHEALSSSKICRVLMDGELPLGWGAIVPQGYGVWELHPLVIDPAYHRKGYGKYLVGELEKLAVAAGATTMVLSTADAIGATTIGGIGLYDDPLGRLTKIDVTNAGEGHAFQFWRKVGYSLVGVLPDAEGRGVPSIQFSKRLTKDNGSK
jgi:aminoglycoside 6'-N-acetyltransferase I